MKETTHRVFSLKYRPATFEDLVGQAHVRQTIVNALLRRQIAHGYLFSGPRGVGKTTAARLFAKALNCVEGPGPKICNACDACREIAAGRSLDVIEMDGASNRKIEDVRTLRENVRFAPASGRYKIYIIDEVHMLTHEAFNALLKTLEEPPEHVVFILATTDPQKIPETIHSRCQELEFRRIPPPDLAALIRQVAKREKISIDAESVDKLCDFADGSARDALVALEQAAAFSDADIREDAVDRLFGWVDRKTQEAVIEAVLREDRKEVFDLARRIEEGGKDVSHFFVQLARILRQAWAAVQNNAKPEPAALAELPPDAMLRMISALLESERGLRRTRQPGLFLAVKLVELMSFKHALALSDIVRRLEDMESRVRTREPSELARSPNPASLNVAEIWRGLLARVAADLPRVADWLKEGRPGTPFGKTLPVEFSSKHRLHKERIADPANQAAVDAALRAVIGEDGWRIEPAVEGSAADRGAAGEAGSPAEIPVKVRAAADLFESKGVRRRS